MPHQEHTLSSDFVLTVLVKTRSAKDEVVGYVDDKLVVRLRACPEKGKANAALLKLLGDYFDVAPSRISMMSGHTSKIKRLKVENFRPLN